MAALEGIDKKYRLTEKENIRKLKEAGQTQLAMEESERVYQQ